MKKYFIALGMLGLAFMATSLTNNFSFKKQDTFAITVEKNLKNYFMPYDTTKGNDPNALGVFAWEQMLALNWAATYDGVNNLERDNPNKEWHYGLGLPYTVVWETYAHRTELRPTNSGNQKKTDFDVIAMDNDLNQAPRYTFGKRNNPITITPATSEYGEVKLDLLNCLDEDNEIGSCILFAELSENDEVSGPGSDKYPNPDFENMVLYQAKINKTGFNYKKYYFNGENMAKDSTLAQIASQKVKNQLPIPDKDLFNSNPSLKSDYKAYRKAYEKKHAGILKKIGVCDKPSMPITKNDKMICLPCSGAEYQDPNTKKSVKSDGVIEIKTAWRRYDPVKDEGTLDNYFHRQAIYFTKDSEKKYTAHNDLFLLIGMHVIRKTQNHPSFIIATFEHNSVEKDGYNYISTPGGDGDYEELFQINKAKRDHSYLHLYDQINSNVHNTIKKVSPNHYLTNYNLVGVQGTYEEGYPTESGSNSFFLSNYVIESDQALSNFYGSFGAPQLGNQDGFYNTIVNGKVLTTGGCKGCHGVAQTKGTDMSFLMDAGKPAEHPDEGLLSPLTLNQNFLSPYSVIKNSTPVFLTTVITSGKNNNKKGRVSSFAVSSPSKKTKYYGLGLNPYLPGQYPQNSPGKNDFRDQDNYPSTNIKFVNFQGNMYGGTANIYINDINSGFLTKADPSKNQVGFGLTSDTTKATTFKITLFEGSGGVINITSMEGYPMIMKSYYDYTTIPKNDPNAKLIIDGKLQYVFMFSDKKTHPTFKFSVYGIHPYEYQRIN